MISVITRKFLNDILGFGLFLFNASVITEKFQNQIGGVLFDFPIISEAPKSNFVIWILPSASLVWFCDSAVLETSGYLHLFAVVCLKISSALNKSRGWGLQRFALSWMNFFLDLILFFSRWKQGSFHLAEALDWVRCVGDVNILQNLEQLDGGRVKLAILFTECEYGHSRRDQKRVKKTPKKSLCS